MVNQSAPLDEKYPEMDLERDSVSERFVRAPPAQPYLARILRDVAQLLNNAADYLERR